MNIPKIEDSLKSSPAYWIVFAIAVIAGGTITVDSRFAKASDIPAIRGEIKQELATHRAFTEAGFLRQRKSQLEDKVFELEAKKSLNRITQVELQQLLRYRAELDDVNRELRKKVY